MGILGNAVGLGLSDRSLHLGVLRRVSGSLIHLACPMALPTVANGLKKVLRLQDSARVWLARAWPRSADSAGRPNQRLTFGGPPRTRPEEVLRLVRRGLEKDRANRPGSDSGADNSPSVRRVGAPPGLRRYVRLRPAPSRVQLGRQRPRSVTRSAKTSSRPC